MPEFHIENEKIEITPSEFISKCNSRDINKLVKELTYRGYIDNDSVNEYGVITTTPAEEIFEKHLISLHGKRHLLTNEEEEVILKIASKFLYL